MIVGEAVIQVRTIRLQLLRPQAPIHTGRQMKLVLTQMHPSQTQIELRTNDSTTVLRMTNIEKFNGGSGYRCDLYIRSGEFSCERPFYFDDSHFPDAVNALRSMNSGRAGKATIKAQWENDFICFTSNELGHVFVTGEVIEYSDLTQRLQFGFRTDQTVLDPLIRDFESLLDAWRRHSN